VVDRRNRTPLPPPVPITQKRPVAAIDAQECGDGLGLAGGSLGAVNGWK
jgi:hypothetical protein